MKTMFPAIAFVLCIICCSAAFASPNRVLVVENLSSPDSVAIAQYYFLKRHIPPVNLCTLRCPATEECSTDQGLAQIVGPVRDFIHRSHLNIDYIVLTKGIPIRFNGGAWNGCSIDSVMTTIDDPLPMRAVSPYFAAFTEFSHRHFGLYLVTRLDGWTVADCRRLVDLGGTKGRIPGAIYLHPAIDKDVDGYYDTNQAIRNAAADLAWANVDVYMDQSPTFHVVPEPLAGYYSWGSNDPNFDVAMYRSLKFAPGAIAETVVSTSGRTFSIRGDNGQSLIADLIADGVTGVKGYVGEPYVDSMAHADILFDHYTHGWDLADSFYAASRYVNWKDIVIGDPLCRPYGKGR